MIVWCVIGIIAWFGVGFIAVRLFLDNVPIEYKEK